MSSPGVSRPEVEPGAMSVDDILRWVDAGVLRVPEFQRPFSWTPHRMVELFESIERGFPIGSLVLWSTDARIPTHEVMGTLPLPAAPAAGSLTYLLDGHQRLATLYSVLRLPAAYPRDDEGRKWWIYRDLSRDGEDDDGFVHVPQGEPAPHLLPLRAIIRTMDFLAFTKDMDARAQRSGLDSAMAMTRRAESLVQHVKSYKLSVLRVLGGTVEEAAIIFKRLNVGETPLVDADDQP